jgi:hypothetical protein
MPIETFADGSHTPSTSGLEEVVDLSGEVGVFTVFIDLADMQSGDDVNIMFATRAGPIAARSVDVQNFVGDQGLVAARLEFPLAGDEGSGTALVLLEQSVGTLRTFPWRVVRVYEA